MNTKTNESESAKIPVIVIFAPTASEKTALTRELFSPEGSHFIFKAQIISADSQSVYKGMDIGTAKPDSELCRILPHHLVDIIEPDIQFNVSDFVDMADAACKKIHEEGQVPVVCGGTGFYIRNFLYGVAKTPVSDEKVRNQLKERIAREGNQALYDELCRIDPQSAEKIHPNDAYRICRALEVYYISGKPRSAFSLEPKLRDCYNFLFIVLEPPRDLLYERIRARVDQMFEVGLEAEVKGLIAKGYTKETPGMKAIGYSEWYESADNKVIREEIKHHSCKYAKKQYTYIRDIPGSIKIPYSGDEASIAKVAELIKSNYLQCSFI